MRMAELDGALLEKARGDVLMSGKTDWGVGFGSLADT